MRKIALLALLLLPSPSFAADSTVSAMTAASALGGTELFYCVQGGADRKCTGTQLQTFINTFPTTIVGGTSGGIPYFSSTTALSSSALLAANALMVGGGAGVAPSTVTTGTGVLTALGVAVGSAGAFARNNAAETISAAYTFTSTTPQLVLGVNATTLGSIKLFGNTSGDLTLAPSAVAGTASVATFPGRSGTVGYTSGALTSGNCAKFDASGNIVDNGAVCGGGGGTPGGANTQVQFNNSSAFGGSANFTWDNTNKALSVGGGTVTTSNPVLNLTQTWNAGAAAFTGVLFNATDTASAASSLLLDIGTGGGSYASKFKVDKSGNTTIAGTLTVASAATVNGLTSNGTLQTGNGYNLFLQGGGVFAMSPNFAPSDTYLFRAGIATFQLGAADAASPVAQTLQVQNVVAGTTNTAGTNFTITGSRGTGTGAGGSLIFQVAPAGGTGSASNPLATSVTFASDKSVQLAGAITTLNSDTGSGITYTAGSGVVISQSGVPSLSVLSTGLRVGSGASFGWSSNASPISAGSDTFLTRAGAASIQLGAADAAAPVAQTLGVQGVIAGTTNTAGSAWTLNGSKSTGSGVGGDIIFKTSAANAAATTQNSSVTMLTLKGSATTTANPGRILAAGQIESSGSVPTAAGSGGTCATGAIVGGANAGTVTLTGACVATNTITLTFPTASATGWSCFAQDRTTPASAVQETSTSTTTAVFTVAATTGATDVIQYACTAY